LLSALTGAAGLLTLVGLIDDTHTLSATPRLLVQVVAVSIVIFMLPAEARLTSVVPFWIERACIVLLGVWFVNLVNFMDGIDWMTVAEVVPITAAIAIFGLGGIVTPIVVLVALSLLGAILGFAPFNRPVARLFLGDVGSLPIGLLLGWLLLLLAISGYFAAALLLPLYYLADASITLLLRVRRRETLWEAHRTHFYQRAVAGGLTVPAVIARVFVTNVALAALATVSVVAPGTIVSAMCVVGGALLVGLLLANFARTGG
jgi:UDP-N-acetylmuramyl pentapeptide phosphotransferase/UDP-N-acetylglucosamine-1-phosphate transferase